MQMELTIVALNAKSNECICVAHHALKSQIMI